MGVGERLEIKQEFLGPVALPQERHTTGDLLVETVRAPEIGSPGTPHIAVRARQTRLAHRTGEPGIYRDPVRLAAKTSPEVVGVSIQRLPGANGSRNVPDRLEMTDHGDRLPTWARRVRQGECHGSAHSLDLFRGFQ